MSVNMPSGGLVGFAAVIDVRHDSTLIALFELKSVCHNEQDAVLCGKPFGESGKNVPGLGITC
jgi:hypothetical protein